MVDLVEFFLEGFKKVVEWMAGEFMVGLESGYEKLAGEMFGTPTPDTSTGFVFGTPTNSPWPALREALVGGEITMLALLLLVMSVQGRNLINVYNLGSGSDDEPQRRLYDPWRGAILIVTWYWAAALLLFFVDGFTLALLPSFDTIIRMMIDYLSVSVTNPMLALLFALIGAISMWIIEIIFFVRGILLFLAVYVMPLVIAVAFSNVPVLSRIAMNFARRFVPLAILPLPAVLVLKGYDFLFSQGAIDPGTAFLKYAVAVSLPVFALYVTWKTFKYASPLTAKVIGGTAKGAAVVGAIAGGAYLAGPQVGATAARWGGRAAAGHAVAQRVSSLHDDNLAGRQTSLREYRRTENDPK